MREAVFERWEDFRAFVNEARLDVPVYWRGQVNQHWPLSSSFERSVLQQARALNDGTATDLYASALHLGRPAEPGQRGFVAAMRQAYFEEFKRAASGLRGPNPAPLNDDQWWALGRHYGLISPLLDWSEKPYIAAFFALSPVQHEMLAPELSLDAHRVAVYRLVHDERLEGDGLRVLNVQVDEVPRLRGQHSIFTLLDSEEYFDLLSFLDSRGRTDLLTRIVLTGRAVADGLLDLDDHGIDYPRLFPDLPGAAMHANTMLQRLLLNIDARKGN